MRIHLQTDNQTIEIAAHLMARYYNDYKFLEKVRAHRGRFNHSSDTPGEVAQKIKDATVDVYIVEYKPLWRWTKAIGHAKFDKKNNRGIIYVNVYKIDLPLMERVNNLMHEFMHFLGYGHKGNHRTPYNELTVPYKVGQMFEEYVQERVDGNV